MNDVLLAINGRCFGLNSKIRINHRYSNGFVVFFVQVKNFSTFNDCSNMQQHYGFELSRSITFESKVSITQ